METLWKALRFLFLTKHQRETMEKLKGRNVVVESGVSGYVIYDRKPLNINKIIEKGE